MNSPSFLPEKMTLNRFSLTFNGECAFLNSIYTQNELEQSRTTIRLTVVLSLFLYCFGGVLDYFLLPLPLVSIYWGIRACVLVLIGLFFLTPSFIDMNRYYQYIVAAGGAMIGGSMVMMVMFDPPAIRSSYFVGLIILFLFLFLLVKARILTAAITSLGLIILFFTGAILYTKTPTSTILVNTIFLCIAYLVSTWVAYTQEHDSRRRFFLNYQLEVIKEKTDQAKQLLEESVIERTQKLSTTNTRLMIEIAEREQAQKEFVFLATHDPLTNLPNRNLMYDRLKRAISRSRRNNLCLGVLFLDLDGFKAINDAYSHTSGDLLLKQVGQRLSALMRENDTVCRFGGDEFVILSDGLPAPSAAADVAQKVLAAIEQPFLLENVEVIISTSIGISIFPNHGDNPDILLKNADIAMYRAKTMGKNNFQFYNENIAEKISSRAALGAQLHRALAQNEFILLYQPQIQLTTGKIVGVEALLRWKHPGEGLVPPSRFIPVAEETGLIVPIGEWALRTACNQVNQWIAEGLPPLRMAVNISGRQLKDVDFAERILRILADTRTPAETIELELTENVVFQYSKNNQSLFQRLKKSGVLLAVDDFGKGFSTLTHLSRLPFNTLKMDKDFADNISNNNNDTIVASGIISIARQLGMNVVAEGVETSQQLQFYQSQGCDFIQGWYYSRAVDAERMTEMLKNGLPNRPLFSGDNHEPKKLV